MICNTAEFYYNWDALGPLHPSEKAIEVLEVGEIYLFTCWSNNRLTSYLGQLQALVPLPAEPIGRYNIAMYGYWYFEPTDTGVTCKHSRASLVTNINKRNKHFYHKPRGTGDLSALAKELECLFDDLALSGLRHLKTLYTDILQSGTQ